jgi:hypothetical protein
VNLGLSTNCGKQAKYAWELDFRSIYTILSTYRCVFLLVAAGGFHRVTVDNPDIGG